MFEETVVQLISKVHPYHGDRKVSMYVDSISKQRCSWFKGTLCSVGVTTARSSCA